MFDIAPTELLLVAVVALVVIGPKDLPRAMRFVGQWVGRARGMARHFRTGIDEMIRQSELEEMERKWAEENARIMREHPAADVPDIVGPDGSGHEPAEGEGGEAPAGPSHAWAMTPLPAPAATAPEEPDEPAPAAPRALP